jgi:hypothetical protein
VNDGGEYQKIITRNSGIVSKNTENQNKSKDDKSKDQKRGRNKDKESK